MSVTSDSFNSLRTPKNETSRPLLTALKTGYHSLTCTCHTRPTHTRTIHPIHTIPGKILGEGHNTQAKIFPAYSIFLSFHFLNGFLSLKTVFSLSPPPPPPPPCPPPTPPPPPPFFFFFFLTMRHEENCSRRLHPAQRTSETGNPAEHPLKG